MIFDFQYNSTLMKKTIILLSILFGGLVYSSCTHHHSHKTKSLPPGQAKKITGSKSAKPYAPGQQKKKDH